MNAVTQDFGRDTTWREELAWAAGFFDGEGTASTSMQANGTSRLTVCVDQNDPRVLERFATAVMHKGRMYGPYQDRTGRFIHWRFQAGKWEYAQAWAAMLWPFLGEVKREQVRRGLLISRGRRGPRKLSCVRGHYFPLNAPLDANGKRVCVQCRRIRNRNWYHRKKAADG